MNEAHPGSFCMLTALASCVRGRRMLRSRSMRVVAHAILFPWQEGEHVIFVQVIRSEPLALLACVRMRAAQFCSMQSAI
eukprot:4174595-Amphidinium_carterae.1